MIAFLLPMPGLLRSPYLIITVRWQTLTLLSERKAHTNMAGYTYTCFSTKLLPSSLRDTTPRTERRSVMDTQRFLTEVMDCIIGYLDPIKDIDESAACRKALETLCLMSKKCRKTASPILFANLQASPWKSQ